jgi:hypothetical protein
LVNYEQFSIPFLNKGVIRRNPVIGKNNPRNSPAIKFGWHLVKIAAQCHWRF